MSQDYHNIRRDYTKGALSKENLPNLPIEAFKRWFDEALSLDIPDANAMVISTVSPKGRPSSRVVLLKEIIEEGLVFYTNYNSHKAKEIEQNPHACFNFFWHDLERQVRVEGKLQKVDAHLSDAYFNSRPLESRLGAICSPQSSEIADRQSLEQLLIEAKAKYSEVSFKRPDYWGGYVLIPDYFEFWQGGAHRLHDRIVYALEGNTWKKKRIAP